MNVNLHIERLVLEGLPIGAREGASVKAALEAELTRLFAREAAQAGSVANAATASVQGAPLGASAAENPPRLGAAIAQSVYGAISK